MNGMQYKDFYERVGKLNGWDFSKVKCVSEGVKWDFLHEVTRVCKPSDIVLDIGTGGGEALISIADSALLLVGIDDSSGMVDTANANIRNSNKKNVRVMHMNSEKLSFPERFFNVVCCRHAPFNANEVAKVLANEGIFLTQQVSEGDKANLKQAFGRGQAFDIPDGTLKDKYLSELSQAGFKDIQVSEYESTEYFETPEDLIFLLKYTPIIPDFGSHKNDFDVLEKFIETYRTDKGIMNHSQRFMITARN